MGRHPDWERASAAAGLRFAGSRRHIGRRLFRPVWIADRRGEADGGPNVVELAQLARRQLRPGSPVIAASPAG